jgi:RHS repeat-associated protein
MQVLQERNAINVPMVTYTRGQDLSGTLGGAGGIGGLLARTDRNGSAYYHADGNGNVTMLVDGSGNVLARYLYDSFGNTLGMWGSLAAANTYRFSSKETDPRTGQYYFGYRYYEPNLQRWLNQDPIGERGGINLYQFVRNSPINYIDPTGRAPQLTSLTYNPSTGQSSAGYTPYQFGQGYGIGFNGPDQQSPLGAFNDMMDQSRQQLAQDIANQLGVGDNPQDVNGIDHALGLVQVGMASECPASKLKLSQTVANHLSDVTKAGDLVRPYGDSRLLMQEIMDAKPPVPDPGGVPGGLRWDVPGTMNGTSGTYQLVVDPNTGTVLHFLFVK